MSHVRTGEDAVDSLSLRWRRAIVALHAEVRSSADPVAAWIASCAVRDRLFAAHPESPLPVERRAGFRGLRYFPYDPASAYWAICAEVEATRSRFRRASVA